MKHSADLPMDPRPLVAITDDYAAGTLDPVHTHARAQLSMATNGSMVFMVGSASYMLPPNRGIWIPAGVPHAVRFRHDVTGHAIYIDPAVAGGLDHLKIFALSPLLRALVQEVASFPADYDLAGRSGMIVDLLLAELRRVPEMALRVPMPTDRRLLRVCELILENPSDVYDLDHWVSVAGMGRRTFTRLFKDQLGMGLTTWRQQVRVMEAVTLLQEGHSITNVAFQVGYDSPSAFTAMFHRMIGAPPSAYFAHVGWA